MLVLIVLMSMLTVGSVGVGVALAQKVTIAAATLNLVNFAISVLFFVLVSLGVWLARAR